MKVKLLIPAVNQDRQYDVGEEVDFSDPNQALALIRAGQAYAVGAVPMPETPAEVQKREKKEADEHQKLVEHNRAEAKKARTAMGEEIEPAIPPLSHSAPGIGGMAPASTETHVAVPAKPAAPATAAKTPAK